MRRISDIVCLAISFFGIATNVFAQDTWSEDSSQAFVAVAAPGSCVLGDKIWIMGGAQSLDVVYYPDTVQIFDPYTHTWSAGTSMTFGRTGFTSSALNGKIYVIGGITENGSSLDTAEAYDSATKEWSSLQSMPSPRDGHCAAIVNGKIYIIGGNSGYFLKSLEIFDPSTNSWNAGPDMPTARDGLTCSVVNGKIYVIGGENRYTEAMDTVEIYDPQANSWGLGTPMPIGLMGSSSCAIDGKIYVTGGFMASKTLEIFDTYTNTWSQGPDMPTGRYDLACCSVDGKMYAIGGVQGISDIPVGAVEVFTPGADAVNEGIGQSQQLIYSYPNPFTQSTQISFTSESDGYADVSVVNLLGAEVARIFTGELSAGEHSFQWDASGAAAGMYECVVRMGGNVQRVPLSVVR